VNVAKWNFEKVESNKNLKGPEVEVVLPKFETHKMTLVLKVAGKP